MKKKLSRFAAILLVFVLSGLICVQAFAAEARNIYGYAAEYANYSSGEFKVEAPGTTSSKGGVTFKVNDFPDYAVIYFDVINPEGKTILSNFGFFGNGENYKVLYNMVPGTYTIRYRVPTSDHGWMHCWIY